MNRRPQGKLLVKVGVVADTHVNESEDSSASPYPANALANPRARAAFAEINAMSPDFVVHLGDMVNPVPELPSYAQAAQNFHDIAGGLDVPLHLLAGNHDIGDKPVSWMPAGRADSETIALYQSEFGKQHYCFERNGIVFIAINSSIINTGIAEEQEQKEWLEATFEANAGKRCFIFIHYPLFTTDESEPGSYDNVDEPGRSWLLDLICKHRPEALFAAHVHNFWYNVVGDTEFYTVPSTCFIRHDYSEMYRIGPGDQNGRNDTAKLGHACLTIYEHGHVLDITRSYGRQLSIGEECKPGIDAQSTDGIAVHSKRIAFDRVGLDIRQPWAEVVEITPSGGIDEFERKKARNDYPLQAIWEMGLRRMRIPIQDLLDPAIRRRIEILNEIGHLFHIYAYGFPGEAAKNILSEYARLVTCFEIVVDWEGPGTDLTDITTLYNQTGIDIRLSRVNRRDATKHQNGRYNHLISHGFTFEEAGELETFTTANSACGTVGGVMLSVPRTMNPVDAVRQGAALANDTAKTICLYLKTSSSSPAENFFDDEANTARVLEAITACVGIRNVEVILDTFADIDRGYFARNGLVDRRYNPKLGSRAVTALIGLLDGKDWELRSQEEAATNNAIVNLVASDGSDFRLLKPDLDSTVPGIQTMDSKGKSRRIDLSEYLLEKV